MPRKKAEPKVEEKIVEEPVVENREETTFDVFLTHQRQAVTSAGKALQSLIPTGLREHGGKAVEEMLEGYRVLFNSAIDDMLDNVRETQDRVTDMTNKVVDKVEEAKLKEKA